MWRCTFDVHQLKHTNRKLALQSSMHRGAWSVYMRPQKAQRKGSRLMQRRHGQKLGLGGAGFTVKHSPGTASLYSRLSMAEEVRLSGDAELVNPSLAQTM